MIIINNNNNNSLDLYNDFHDTQGHVQEDGVYGWCRSEKYGGSGTWRDWYGRKKVLYLM